MLEGSLYNIDHFPLPHMSRHERDELLFKFRTIRSRNKFFNRRSGHGGRIRCGGNNPDYEAPTVFHAATFHIRA
jgi:hypothetical protein